MKAGILPESAIGTKVGTGSVTAMKAGILPESAIGTKVGTGSVTAMKAGILPESAIGTKVGTGPAMNPTGMASGKVPPKIVTGMTNLDRSERGGRRKKIPKRKHSA